MRRTMFRWLARAASSAAAMTLTLALGTGIAAARDDSDDSGSPSASSSNASSDSDDDSDNDRSGRSSANRRGGSSDPHHHAALGVVLRQNSLEIRRVVPDSPADHAGLRRGDDILTVNGKRVSAPEDLVRAIQQADDDERVKLGILRDGEHETVRATLASSEQVFGRQMEMQQNQYGRQGDRGNRQYAQSQNQNEYDRNYVSRRGSYQNRQAYPEEGYEGGRGYGQQGYGQPRYSANQRGSDLGYGEAPEGYDEDDDHLAQYRRSRRGALGVTLDEDARGPVRINHVYEHGPAHDAGLRPGDEIVSVDGRRVRSTEDLIRVLASKHPREQVRLAVDRDGRERTIRATMGAPHEVFAGEEEGYRTTRATGREYDDGAHDASYRRNSISRGYDDRRNEDYDDYQD